MRAVGIGVDTGRSKLNRGFRGIRHQFDTWRENENVQARRERGRVEREKLIPRLTQNKACRWEAVSVINCGREGLSSFITL